MKECKLCQRKPTLNLNHDFVSCRNPDCPMYEVEMTKDEWEILNTDLQAQNDDLVAKLELMTKLGSDMADELQANHNNQQTRLMSMKWYKTVDSSNAQSLADIRAEAVMSLTESGLGFAHYVNEFESEWVYSEDDIKDHANKIKGAE